jgi:hypothetical protein
VDKEIKPEERGEQGSWEDLFMLIFKRARRNPAEESAKATPNLIKTGLISLLSFTMIQVNL